MTASIVLSSQNRQQLAEFQIKHRTALLCILFTDLVGSTQLKQDLGDILGASLMQEYRKIVRELLLQFSDGEEIATAGDSFLIVFVKPSDSVKFSILLQRALREFSQTTPVPIRNRIGIHLGEVIVEERADSRRPKDLYGSQVDLCARVMSLGDGDQTLMTRSVFDNSRPVLKGQEIQGVAALSWMNHGLYSMKGLDEPVEVCEVGETGLSVLAAPPDTEKAKRYITIDSEPVLGWRPAVDLQVPDTDWLLVEKIGEGGFGEVWKARHRKLKNECVIKFCFSETRVRALKREVTLFRILREKVGDHPHIVRIHDVYWDQPPYYIVMDYIPGKDLCTWCAERGGIEQIPLETRIEIVAQSADALQAAHEAGIIHRDIKPSNILLQGKGIQPSEIQVKLTDFGIGQVTSEDVLFGFTKMGFTQTIVASDYASQSGTHMYMAPELLAGTSASARSDIYSLGVVLYQLAIGDLKKPLTMDWTRDVDDPMLREDLERCFSGDPLNRFASAAELSRELRRLDERRKDREIRLMAERMAMRRKTLLQVFSAVLLAFLILSAILGYGFLKEKKLREDAETARIAAEAAESVASTEQYASNMVNIGHTFGIVERPHSQRLLFNSPKEYRDWEWGWFLRRLYLDKIRINTESSIMLGFDISRDDTQIAVGTREGDIKLYDLSTGGLIRTTKGHDDAIYGLKYSPDNRFLATASADQTIKLWNAQTLDLVKTFTGHAGSIFSLDFHPDGSYLLSGSYDTTTKVWDLANGDCLKTLADQPNFIQSVAWSPNKNRIVTALGKEILIWSFPEYELLNRITQSTNTVSLRFRSDGRILAAGFWDGSILLWDMQERKEIVRFAAFPSSINDIQFNSDHSLLYCSTGSGHIVGWHLDPYEKLFSYPAYEYDIPAIRITRDEKTIVTSSLEGEIRIWDISQLYEAPKLKGHSHSILSVAIAPDNRFFATAGMDGSIKIWDRQKGVCAHILNSSEHGFVFDIAFSPDGQSLAAGYEDGFMVIWNPDTGQAMRTIPSHDLAVLCLDYSFDGKFLASGSYDAKIKVWDAKTGENRGIFEGHQKAVSAVDFNPECMEIASSSWDGTIKIWDLENRKEKITLYGHIRPINDLVYQSRRLLLSGSDDSMIKTWNLGMERNRDAYEMNDIRTTEELTDSIQKIAISKSAARVFVVTQKGLSVVDARTGHLLLTLTSKSRIQSIALSDNGLEAIAGCEDGTIQFFEAFPFEEDQYPGSADQVFDERLRQYKENQSQGKQVIFQDAVPESNSAQLAQEGIYSVQTHLTIPPRDSKTPPNLIDLSSFFNAQLDRRWSLVPTLEWLYVNLGHLPRGMQEFNRIPFDIRGVIQLNGRGFKAMEFDYNREVIYLYYPFLNHSILEKRGTFYPEQVTEIPIQQKGQTIHVLHGTQHPEFPDRAIGYYRIRYDDNTTYDFEIVYGKDVLDWFHEINVPSSSNEPVPAWKGTCDSFDKSTQFSDMELRIYSSHYSNPFPEKTISSMDFVSENTISGPFLLAITIE